MAIKGAYLAYSYDFNQIFGKNVQFEFLDLKVSCEYLKGDLASGRLGAFGHVEVERKLEKYAGDAVLVDLKTQTVVLAEYGAHISVKEILGKNEGQPRLDSGVLDDLTLQKVQSSLVYFTCPEMEINSKYETIGFQVTIYVEGVRSFGHKKLNLTKGPKMRIGGLSLKKIWYTKSQGLITNAAFEYENEDKITTLTQIQYEEHTLVKGYSGLSRQFNLLSSTHIALDKKSRISLLGNFDSSRQWSAQFSLDQRWSERFSSNLTFSRFKPANMPGDTWIGLQSLLNTGIGNLNLNGKLETRGQGLYSLSYSKSLFRRLRLGWTASYSKLRAGMTGNFSKIVNSFVSMTYSGGQFNLGADYLLNSDLQGNQVLSRPQLSLGLNPVRFYGGFLIVDLRNILSFNKVLTGETKNFNYNNNAVFSLSTASIDIRSGFRLNFALSLEQFLEKGRRNFTSSGLIVKARKSLTQWFALEGYYSYQSRRKTENWFIEGTTSQDLSMYCRFNFSPTTGGWLSFSYDPKHGEWRQMIADLSLGLTRKWMFHTLMDYDFMLGRLNNIDLYVIRQAGGFQLRIIWRSLSKQFLVELVPGGSSPRTLTRPVFGEF